MKLYKNLIVLLLLFGFFADKVRKTKSDIVKDLAAGSLIILAEISAEVLSGPFAPIAIGSLMSIALATDVLQKEIYPVDDLTKTNFLESQEKVMESLKSIDSQISNLSVHLTDIIESHAFFEEMRNDLETLSVAFSDNFKLIMDPKMVGVTKKAVINTMLDYFSDFRHILRSFVTKYIKPKDVVPATGEVKLFYDYVLTRNKNAVNTGDDCGFESVHTKLFKSFMYLFKTLSDAYAMVISAHAIQYQKELKANDDSALETRKVALKLLDSYKADMKIFMEKTKSVLDIAPRDVRNCGTFGNFKKGDTFDRVSFANILPIFKDWSKDTKSTYSKFSGSRQQCFIRQEDVKYADYIVGDCFDGDLHKHSTVTVYVDPKNSEWPYVYLKCEPILGADTVYGNSSKPIHGLIERKFTQMHLCFSIFCNAFKDKVFGVSTAPVSVDEDSVITGVQFAIRNNIIYIDVQEGTLRDDLTVDPSSLTWLITPPSDEVLYLDFNIRKFELGDVEVQDNNYLRTIQFQLKNTDEGIIGLSVNGNVSEPRNGTPKSNEINLSGSESPERFGATGVKNLVSKPPVPLEPYHVGLQPTDFKKDLGATTIPYFDARKVLTNPPAPLAGIGMYHQTIQGSGGFISLKIKQVNLSRFVDYELVNKTISSSIKI